MFNVLIGLISTGALTDLTTCWLEDASPEHAGKGIEYYLRDKAANDNFCSPNLRFPNPQYRWK